MKSPRSIVSLAVSPFRSFAGWVTYWHFKMEAIPGEKKKPGRRSEYLPVVVI